VMEHAGNIPVTASSTMKPLATITRDCMVDVPAVARTLVVQDPLAIGASRITSRSA
jgi:hypothetical protein